MRLEDRVRRGPAATTPALRWVTALVGLLAVWLLPRLARADDALNASSLPLSKTFDQPFFSLNGSHVELFSLLFLFMTTVVVMAVKRRRQLVRHVVQLISLFIFFYIVFSCLGVFGMLRNAIHGISLIGTVYTEAFFWLSLPVCVVAFTIISGPFFCGWICPTGTIQELVAIAREWVSRGRRIAMTPITGSLLAGFTATFLYVVFSVSAKRQLFVEDSSLYWAACSLLVPVFVLTRLASDSAARHLRTVSLGSILVSATFKVTITSPVHFAFVDVVDPASAITTGVLAVASIFVARAWCRYLCPWGLLMSLTHRFSRLRVVANTQTECDRCNKCVDVCRIGAVESMGKVNYEHCQLCYACVDVCGKQRLSIVDLWREQQSEALAGEAAQEARGEDI